MSSTTYHLSEILNHYVSRAGYTSGQLARLSGVPKATIVNWLEGRVRRPRGSEDLLRLAAVLHLSAAETSELLQAAGHPTVAELREQATQNQSSALNALLASWPAGEPPRPGSAPFQAIADLPHFVGRQSLLQTLTDDILNSPQRGIYTLQGMAGVGKSTLAARLAYLLRPHFPDGVLWARVDISDTMSILSTFARAYGLDVAQYADLGSRSRVVRELLANKQAIIILDNAQSSQQIEPLLPPSGPCAIIITTRHRHLAAARGARQYMLGPFNQSGEESLALFARVLGHQRVTDDQDTLASIAQLLGHLPLALDVVASRLAYEPGWSSVAFLHRLKQEKRQLQELTYEAQNVRLSFEWSYEALTPDAQQFFAALGLFEGDDFSPEAAAHLTNEPLTDLQRLDAEDMLRHLYGLSLVRQARPGRYRLHPLLRAFARDKLNDPTPQRRLVTYYVQFVTSHQRQYTALDTENNNILAALRLADELRLYPEYLSGVTHFYHFWEARGLYELAAGQLQRAQEIARQLADDASLVMVLRCQGRAAERRNQYEAAEAYYEEGLQLARQLQARQPPEQPDQVQPPAVTSDLLRALGVLAARRGDYALAEAYYQEGLLLARHVQQGDTLGSLLRGLGVEAFSRGDFVRAETLYEEGLALAHTAGERERQSALLWALGMLAEDQGHLADAESYLRQSAALARELGHLERVALLMRDLGVIAWEQGETDKARSYFEEGIAIARDLGHTWRLNRLLLELGELSRQQGAITTAAIAFREVLDIARQSNSQEMAAQALFGLAQVAASQNDPAGALAAAHESLTIFKTIGHHQAAEVKNWLQSGAVTQA